MAVIGIAEDTRKISIKDNNYIYKKPFISILGKQYDELAYSNMFAYFFQKYPEMFVEFIKNIDPDIKNKDINTNELYEVKREEGRIDLLIYTKNNVFIIENKIKSKINGEKYNVYSEEYVTNQLVKYYDFINGHDNENDEEETYKRNYKEDNQHYYIFKPNYNDIDIKKIRDGFADDNHKDRVDRYKSINYSELLKAFNECKTTIDEVDKKYFEEFKNALELHTESTDNIIEKEMEYKFRQAIKKVKK